VEESSPPAVRVVMEPALRLIQGDAHQWSEQTRSCPVIRASGYTTSRVRYEAQRVTDKTDRTLVGRFTTRRDLRGSRNLPGNAARLAGGLPRPEFGVPRPIHGDCGPPDSPEPSVYSVLLGQVGGPGRYGSGS